MATAIEERVVEGKVLEVPLENGEELVELDGCGEELDLAEFIKEIPVQDEQLRAGGREGGGGGGGGGGEEGVGGGEKWRISTSSGASYWMRK